MENRSTDDTGAEVSSSHSAFFPVAQATENREQLAQKLQSTIIQLSPTPETTSAENFITLHFYVVRTEIITHEHVDNSSSDDYGNYSVTYTSTTETFEDSLSKKARKALRETIKALTPERLVPPDSIDYKEDCIIIPRSAITSQLIDNFLARYSDELQKLEEPENLERIRLTNNHLTYRERLSRHCYVYAPTYILSILALIPLGAALLFMFMAATQPPTARRYDECMDDCRDRISRRGEDPKTCKDECGDDGRKAGAVTFIIVAMICLALAAVILLVGIGSNRTKEDWLDKKLPRNGITPRYDRHSPPLESTSTQDPVPAASPASLS